jgi:hypothetical protein
MKNRFLRNTETLFQSKTKLVFLPLLVWLPKTPLLLFEKLQIKTLLLQTQSLLERKFRSMLLNFLLILCRIEIERIKGMIC